MRNFYFAAIAMIVTMLTSSLSTPAYGQDENRTGKGKASDAVLLDITPVYVPDTQMMIDSNINEWNGVEGIRFGPLLSGEIEYDWTGIKDLSVSLKARYSIDKLYLLVQVKDNAVTARRMNWKSDKVEIWLLSETNPIKNNKGLVGLSFDMGPLTQDLPPETKWLSPGKKGKPNILSATIKLYDGYDIEMAIPFSEIAALSPAMDDSLRFCVLVRDWDQDNPNEDEVSMASCKVQPKSAAKLKKSDMGLMKFDLAEKQWKTVLKNKGIDEETAKNDLRARGNVVGNALPEIIALHADKLLASGYGFHEGQLSWSEFDFALPDTSKVQKMEVINLNGDAYDEVLVFTTEPCTDPSLEADLIHILQYRDEHFVSAAIIQTAQRLRADATQAVSNSVQFTKKGLKSRLDAGGAKQEHCEFASSQKHLPLLLPQDGPSKRSLSYSELGLSYIPAP